MFMSVKQAAENGGCLIAASVSFVPRVRFPVRSGKAVDGKFPSRL